MLSLIRHYEYSIISRDIESIAALSVARYVYDLCLGMSVDFVRFGSTVSNGGQKPAGGAYMYILPEEK